MPLDPASSYVSYCVEVANSLEGVAFSELEVLLFYVIDVGRLVDIAAKSRRVFIEYAIKAIWEHISRITYQF
jgi:hypothetical protein